MPKYDAFGREIGEDSLESLGWSSGGEARPAAEPAEPATAPPPAEPPPSPPAIPRSARRRRSGGARIMSRLITFAVLAAIAANVLPDVSGRIKDATKDLDVRINPPEAPALPNGKPEKPPVGLGSGSLIRRGALAEALADLRRRGLGRLTHLRLAPERIDVQTLSRGRLISSQLSTADGFRRFSVSGPGFGGSSTIPWNGLDPRAPERLVRAAAERIHKPVSKIDYLVPSEVGGAITWGAYFKGGQIVQGDARGKVTRRIS